MANDFKKPEKIEYESLKQDAYDPNRDEEKTISKEFEDQPAVETSAEVILDEYERTIQFQKFVEGLLRDLSVVEVEIDPEDDPEVWMAMNRIFDNPSPKLNQNSYFQVLDALETMERVEQAEDSPRNGIEEDFLSNLPDAKEVDEGEILDDGFQISAIDEIEEKAKVKRSGPFKKPDPPRPPEQPPTDISLLRRWKNYFKTIDVLGKPYKVEWLKDRWWKKK